MENNNQTQTIGNPQTESAKQNFIMRQFHDFFDFIRTQGVVGFAIGFILGRAVSDLVASLVNDIINPFIGLLTGRLGDLSQMTLQISTATISYGKFLSLIINFIILAAIVYFIFKQLKIEKLDKPKK